LRRAGPADAARLSLIGGATFLEAYGSDHPGDALIAHIEAQHSAAWYRRMLADPACAAWVLEAGWGAQAGYAVLTLPDLACETGARDVELKRLYLLGGWQSGGWGGLLLGLVETEAAARDQHMYISLGLASPWTRADYAERAKQHGYLTPLLFQLLDGRDPRPSILRTLKPSGDTRALTRTEATA
jgi:hypothetical protein